MRSFMLRGTRAMARAEECEAMTGAVLIASTSSNVASETCEMSTIMPRRFISRTTSRPKSLRPALLGVSVDESAQSTFTLCVSVM